MKFRHSAFVVRQCPDVEGACVVSRSLRAILPITVMFLLISSAPTPAAAATTFAGTTATSAPLRGDL